MSRKENLNDGQYKQKDEKFMGHDYKYISENCQEELSLHDCLCSHLYFQDDRLIFEME